MGKGLGQCGWAGRGSDSFTKMTAWRERRRRETGMPGLRAELPVAMRRPRGAEARRGVGVCDGQSRLGFTDSVGPGSCWAPQCEDGSGGSGSSWLSEDIRWRPWAEYLLCAEHWSILVALGSKANTPAFVEPNSSCGVWMCGCLCACAHSK